MAHVTQTTRLWHPFAAMGKVDGHELVLVRGEGSRVWDAEGTEYIDATAGLWFANVGHGRAEIADAVAAQLRTLAAHHVFGDHANEPALELAARLADLAPLADAAVFFGTGGGEAVDAAAKIARRYWALSGQPQRTVLVSRRFAYHGTNAYGTSLSGIPAVRDGYGTLVGDVVEVAHDDPEALATALDGLGDRAAAFIGEPMIGAGGVIPPPEGYWPDGRADLPRTRRPADLRRGDLRLRTARRVVRLPALRLHAGSHDLREGHLVGLRAAERRHRLGSRARAVLARGRGALPARGDVRRAPWRMRRGPREPRHRRARGAGGESESARARAARAPGAASSRTRGRGRARPRAWRPRSSWTHVSSRPIPERRSQRCSRRAGTASSRAPSAASRCRSRRRSWSRRTSWWRS